MVIFRHFPGSHGTETEQAPDPSNDFLARLSWCGSRAGTTGPDRLRHERAHGREDHRLVTVQAVDWPVAMAVVLAVVLAALCECLIKIGAAPRASQVAAYLAVGRALPARTSLPRGHVV
jgi:hypothetical protein